MDGDKDLERRFAEPGMSVSENWLQMYGLHSTEELNDRDGSIH